jgi:Tfp pilus assembly pilus retraction ATPase PilT
VLQAVISQLLLPRHDKPGRVAAFEIMINTPSIGALIRDNKTFRINSDIQTGAKYGMVTLDGFLMDKYSAGDDLARGSHHQVPGPDHDVMQKLQEQLARAWPGSYRAPVRNNWVTYGRRSF